MTHERDMLPLYDSATKRSAIPPGQKFGRKASENPWVDMFGRVPLRERGRGKIYVGEYTDVVGKTKFFTLLYYRFFTSASTAAAIACDSFGISLLSI